MSINIQSPVSLSTAAIKQVRRQFSCSGFLLSSNTHPHPCFSFVPWSLAWLHCEGGFFPLPNTVTGYHNTWQTSEGSQSLLLFKFQVSIWDFWENPCPFSAWVQFLWGCCTAASQHPASPRAQNSKTPQNAAVPRHDHWLRSHITGWTQLLKLF